MHIILFCTLTNQRTIISQIITLLHVSTLYCHPLGACNPYLAKLYKYISCIWITCVISQGIDYELSEDDTIVSKHVAVW